MCQTFAASCIRTGVKEFLRMIEHHIERIEQPEFQIQFVALSGFSVLELVLTTHVNVKTLLTDMATGQVGVQGVYDRIVHILSEGIAKRDMSFDGSIVVYLYCLLHFDLDLAYSASLSVLRTRGLFWSRKLAFRIIEKNRVGHFRNVVDVSGYVEFDDRNYPQCSNALLRAS